MATQWFTELTRSSNMVIMNRLSDQDRVRVVAALIEGNSIRSTVRLTGVAKNTIVKLLKELSDACTAYHDANVRGLKSKRVQCDEIWSFVGAKQKNVSEDKAEQWGDVWTWTALDAETKLIVSYLVGQRGPRWANAFMQDVAARIDSRVQMTTDGHRAYLEAVEGEFGMDIDDAMLVKQYGTETTDTRYNPGECTSISKIIVQGDPDPRGISTSFVERQDLTMRMSMHRFTRLTTAFSKKIANHEASVAVYFMYYNFCRVHQALHVTPAMETGLTDHIWSIAEMIGVLLPH